MCLCKRGVCSCKAGRAQVSMEFLVLMALTFLITIPLIIFFFQESQSATEEVNLAQVGQVVRRIAGAAELVYSFGEPSSVTLKVYVPSGVDTVLISNTEIAFVVNNKGSLLSVFETVTMNVTGNLSTGQGIHNIKVTAINNSVVISELSS